MYTSQYQAWGDSLTYGSIGVDRGKGEHYAYRVWQYLTSTGKTVNFINRGIHGTVSSTVLASAPYWVALEPDVITLMIGTNDASGGVPVATYQTNVERIIDVIRTVKNKVIVIYLCKLTRRNDAIDVSPYNDALETIAINKNVPLIDTYNAYTDVSSNVMDTVHYNPLGATAVANKIIERLTTDKILSSLK